MIVGTAGHIDHGKTALVRALTGVDTDRLPEERQRGISIELGYAFLDLPGAPERIGFIDVPGHERLVHTMLAGATGMDLALLLVAADDGVMPQTREHLAVLSLLGLPHCVGVVTKTDRVSAERVEAVRAELSALLHAGGWRDAPVLAVSAHRGDGLDALRQQLAAAAARPGRTVAPEQAFRLAIDRAFSLAGAGTVVTGTVHAGEVQVGDELQIVGAGRPTLARVRSVHAQNRAVDRARAGQRCALALAGLSKEDVNKGDWACTPACALAADRLDVSLRLWHDEPRPLRSGTPVHVHLGAADGLGTVAVLDADGAPADALAPGQAGRVQLVMRRPLGAWRGDRVVLRDASASRTVAGGRVLDPLAPTRYRRTPQRRAELDALARDDAPARLDALLQASPQGVDLRRLSRSEGLRDAAPLRAALPAGTLLQREAQAEHALAATFAAQAREQVLRSLADFHRQAEDVLGPEAGRLRRLALPRWPEPLWRALLEDLKARGELSQRGAFVHLPAHGVALSATESRLAQKTAPLLAAAGYEGAWMRDLARDAGEPQPLMQVTLARLAQQGELHQVVRDLYYPAATITRLAAIARRLAAEDGEVTAARFRDATGLGRKRAIQVLEYFDKVGLLRRVGDVHRLRADSRLFAEAAA